MELLPDALNRKEALLLYLGDENSYTFTHCPDKGLSSAHIAWTLSVHCPCSVGRRKPSSDDSGRTFVHAFAAYCRAEVAKRCVE